ncbi:MAG: tetratricopeptide repeat protein [Campylobacterota bacterium]|nr:tetratricopeptide repeat protein [Campylobacterota bacterium]
MKRSVLVVLLTTAVPLLLMSAEPSAFGAGDLNNPNPYGLTSSEKVILQNKDKLHKVTVKSNNQANEVDSLRERIDGLQSIIESLSRKSHNNKVNLSRLNEENSISAQNSDEYEKRLGEVIQANSENITEMKTSMDKLKTVMGEVSLLVDSINKDYVTKAEFNSLVNDVNSFKTLMVKELKSSTKSTKSTKAAPKYGKKTNAQIATDAEAFFNKKYYTNAIENYEYLIKKNYRPAYAHYMIGEMNYKRKNYANAISYFKKSSSLYSKGSYMPNLMLHTAISMHKTDDKENAKKFFQAVVAKYPGSSEAEEASKYL